MRPTLPQWKNAISSGTIAHLLRTSVPEASISVNAWIRTVRRQKHVSFLSLSDGSSHDGIQAVIPSRILERCSAATRQALTAGASVSLEGQLTRKKAGIGVEQGQMELQVEGVRLLGECDGTVRVRWTEITD